MNPLSRRYREKYGSIEPYLVLKMQIAVITALIITILGTIFNPMILVFNLVTFAILTHTMYQIKKQFREKLIKYTSIFASLYAAAVLVPPILTMHRITPSPGTMDTILMLLIIILVVVAFSNIMITKKGIKAKVTLANKETAVIEPEYDLMTGIKPGKYAVDNKGAEEGDRVIVKLSKSPFQGPKPKEIKQIIK